MSLTNKCPVTAPADRAAGFWSLAQKIAQAGTRGAGRLAFLREVSKQLLAFSDCQVADWWMTDVEQDYWWRMSADPAVEAAFEFLKIPVAAVSPTTPGRRLADQISSLMGLLSDENVNSKVTHRSYCVNDAAARSRLSAEVANTPTFHRLLSAPEKGSMLLLLLKEETALVGLLVLTASRNCPFVHNEILFYEQLADAIGRAVVNRRAQFRLRERIKELTCLHGIARLSRKDDGTTDQTLQAIVDLLPPAMQFPRIAAARLVLDDKCYFTCSSANALHRLPAKIVVAGRERGSLEVSYFESHPEFVTGPFLREESDLLSSVSHEIAMIVEHSEAAAVRAALAEQLRHQDRLATIGQLAAGVAHELNEPLGNIMGFAQLLQKYERLPKDAVRDIGQIVSAALHGREIVKKLLLFARQSEEQKVSLDLGALVRDSVYFLEARCRKMGIELRLDLSDAPTPIVADPSQMTQVLVNLGVNAIQAMSSGGVLTIGTKPSADKIVLTIQDTGEGMDEKTQERLFTPFFTTKDVGEGTGLGLSVVLGIVSAHGGTIHVESNPGQGARFEISLPAAKPSNA